MKLPQENFTNYVFIQVTDNKDVYINSLNVGFVTLEVFLTLVNAIKYRN